MSCPCIPTLAMLAMPKCSHQQCAINRINWTWGAFYIVVSSHVGALKVLLEHVIYIVDMRWTLLKARFGCIFQDIM